MSNYLKPKNSLPDLNSPLSLRLLSQAIILANSEVTKATKDSNNVTMVTVLLHTPALLQQLPPIFPYTYDILEYSKFFQTPPCFTIPITSQLKVPLTVIVLRQFFGSYIYL